MAAGLNHSFSLRFEIYICDEKKHAAAGRQSICLIYLLAEMKTNVRWNSEHQHRNDMKPLNYADCLHFTHHRLLCAHLGSSSEGN